MISEEQIKELAYSIWAQEGRLEGKNQEYYFRAKDVLEKREKARVIELPPLPPILELSPPPVATTVSQPSKLRKSTRRRKK